MDNTETNAVVKETDTHLRFATMIKKIFVKPILDNSKVHTTDDDGAIMTQLIARHSDGDDLEQALRKMRNIEVRRLAAVNNIDVGMVFKQRVILWHLMRDIQSKIAHYVKINYINYN